MQAAAVVVAALLLWAASCSAAAGPPSHTPAACAQFAPLYQNIERDLARWQAAGISEKLMQRTIKEHASLRRSPHSQKGFAAGFVNGTAVLLLAPELSWSGHHVAIWFVYMRALLQLQHKFGALIPDVEFVISSVDRPLKLSTNSSRDPDQPVFRFCKTDAHPDVLIPVFHFYVKGMVGYLMKKRAWLEREYPWDKKIPTLFGRFTPYNRHLDTQDVHAQRVGAAGQAICSAVSSESTLACTVRQHFVEWSKGQNASLLNVDLAGRLPMKHHARYKYLVHLDGQGLSSRLEQLLTLGSVVFKEESGYRGFYHSLLQPHEHYVPFWRRLPEEVLDGLDWVRAHDAEARAIAGNAQAFAHKYFSGEALACYWLTLLTRFSQLQRYLPGRKQGRVYMPIAEYLETVAKRHEGGRIYNAFAFVDGKESD